MFHVYFEEFLHIANFFCNIMETGEVSIVETLVNMRLIYAVQEAFYNMLNTK